MDYLNPNLFEYGLLFALIVIFSKEAVSFVKWLLTRNNGRKNGWQEKTYKQVQMLNSNHLNSIEKTLRDGNDKLYKAISEGNAKIIELLARIEGRLSK